MKMRESTVHSNHNPSLYITELSPHNHVFIMVAYPGHILESTKGIAIKFDIYIAVSKRNIEDKNHNTSYITFYLNYLS